MSNETSEPTVLQSFEALNSQINEDRPDLRQLIDGEVQFRYRFALPATAQNVIEALQALQLNAAYARRLTFPVVELEEAVGLLGSIGEAAQAGWDPDIASLVQQLAEVNSIEPRFYVENPRPYWDANSDVRRSLRSLSLQTDRFCTRYMRELDLDGGPDRARDRRIELASVRLQQVYDDTLNGRLFYSHLGDIRVIAITAGSIDKTVGGASAQLGDLVIKSATAMPEAQRAFQENRQAEWNNTIQRLDDLDDRRGRIDPERLKRMEDGLLNNLERLTSPRLSPWARLRLRRKSARASLRVAVTSERIDPSEVPAIAP